MGVRGKPAGAPAKPRQAPKADKPKADTKKKAAEETKKAAAKPDKAAKANGAAKPNGKVPAASGAVDKTHNLGSKQGLSEEQRQQLAFQHKKEYKAALAAKKKADADLKNAAKRIKAEGGNMKQIKLMIELETDAGIAEFRATVVLMAEAARWAGATQLEMFGPALGDTDRTPAVDRAYQEGRAAGFEGEKPESWAGGYQAGSPQYNRWIEGYRDAQARLMRKLKPTPIEEAAEKPKHGDDGKKGDFAKKLGEQTDKATAEVISLSKAKNKDMPRTGA